MNLRGPWRAPCRPGTISSPMGKANSASGDGSLSTTTPRQGGHRQIRLRPGQSCSYRGRSAVLRFRSSSARTTRSERCGSPLRRACLLDAAARSGSRSHGPVTLDLFAKSSAVDTDFTGKLVDVWPNGFAQNLTEGILRASFRASTAGRTQTHHSRARSTSTRSTSGPRATCF